MDAPNSNYTFRLLSMRLPDGTVIETDEGRAHREAWTSSATREKQRQEAAERARKSAWGIE